MGDMLVIHDPGNFAIRSDLFDIDQEWSRKGLRARSREEASDPCLTVRVHVRPNDRRTEFVGLGDDGVVRDKDPFAVQAHAIVALLRVPIDVLDAEAVGERTAQSLFAGELVEPCMQRIVRVAAVVAGMHGQAADAFKRDAKDHRSENVPHRSPKIRLLIL